jgi:hypothetical protein
MLGRAAGKNLKFLVFSWAFSPRTLIRREGRDLLHPWAPAFAGVTIRVRHFDTGKVGQPDALQAVKPMEGYCASLAIDRVERVAVVMKDGAARKAPLAGVVFDQLARVAAGRKAAVVAVL